MIKNIYTEILNVIHSVIIAIITFLTPVFGIVLTVLSFVAFDTLIAYWRVKKLRSKWTSKKLRVGLVNKCITYIILILLFFLMDKFILNHLISQKTGIDHIATHILSLVFIYIEYTSIDESYKIIKGKTLLQSLKELIGQANNIKNDLKNSNEDKDKNM